ncbi:MAG: SulP family inorganic anion transporter [Marivita sp.]|uniref:SulP family inorganic anion transporter n=1 Tax=Marivita sp. TaxID=2003365 RepID=UPI0025C39FD7|nr:SulP family inorganic anion transporter [Marivita sp.]MCI5112302.1 SulP family inorganic anion transporter [Marivita sp.]
MAKAEPILPVQGLASKLKTAAGHAVPPWAGRVTRTTLRGDLTAGLTGATLVLPQGVAFASIAGLPPQYGFYTAMVTPVVAALFGSSWHAVSGPTTAISILVFGALAEHFVPGSPDYISAAITLALCVGLFQLILGIARLGVLVDFVSHSVMTGFITGAALLIAVSQIRHVLALNIPRTESLVEHFGLLWEHLPQTDWRALAIALLALTTGAAIKHVRPLWPNYLLALFAATLASLLFGGSEAGLTTIGTIEGLLPVFELPALGLGFVQEFGGAIVAIGLVGLLEAMSVSRGIALRSGQLIDGNREFVAQGLSNIAASFFRCYPGSASFTRSGVNFDAGAQTPLSAIFAALFLAAILFFVAPFFAYVPISGMAGVILLVAWRLIDFREIRHIVTTSTSEIVIAAVTFLSALFLSLEFAIYAGVLLSLALFLKGTARPFIGVGAPNPDSPRRKFMAAAENGLAECPQLLIARIDGPLYFGSVEFLRRRFRRFEIERPEQRHLLFLVKGVGEIDLSGADFMIEEAARRQKRGGTFHLQLVTPRTIAKLARLKVFKALTKENIHLSKGDAIAAVVPTLDQSICARCTARIFLECPGPEPEPSSDSGRSASGT